MENRRNFFKAIGLFAAGVVGAKIASYTPKKKEEELQVAESVTVKDADGKEYNMVVVPKKEESKPVAMPRSSSFDSGERMRFTSDGQFVVKGSATYNGIITATTPPESVLTISQNKKLRKLHS